MKKSVWITIAVVGYAMIVIADQRAQRESNRKWQAYAAEVSRKYEEDVAPFRQCMQEGFDRYRSAYPDHLRLTLMTKSQQRAYHEHSAYTQKCLDRY